MCHHGDPVCNPDSSCTTTKLYGTSARGCNNNARVQKKNNIFTFPTVDLFRTYWFGSGQPSVTNAKLATLNSLCVVSNISILHNYHAKYYDYIVKVIISTASSDTHQLVTQTAPFQTINLTIDLVVSMELIKQVVFSAKLSKSSEADIVLKERGFTQS